MTTGGVNSSLENGSVRSSLLFGGIDLRWPIGFFIVALIAAVLGFGGIAATASGIAQFIFYVFLTLFAVSLLAHLLRGTRL